jgi:4-guanidinobutyraldehyde dehydrogenase/NAD-dependent aldehyde dehydrogenase
VVLKPSEKSPLTALRLGELAIEAGIPAGVLNVLPGSARPRRAAGAAHGRRRPGVHRLDRGGQASAGCAGRSNMKRAYMECGGKSPNLVFADAPDLKRAAEAAASGIFYNQGEVCTAASRLLVERSDQGRVRGDGGRGRQAHAAAPSAGPGRRRWARWSTRPDPRVLSYIEQGQAEGGKLVLGGARASGGRRLLHRADHFRRGRARNTDRREEIFGPVLSVIAFDDEEASPAVSPTTATTAWLPASGPATSPRTPHVARKLRAGSVWVNYWDGGDMTAPFGGYKAIRQRPRQVAARLREIHRAQGDLDQPGEDLAGILEHLVKYKVADPEQRIRAIVEGVRVLKENPLIGRPVPGNARELVIGRDSRGYLALYEYDSFADRVLVLAIRSQREAGYSEPSSENR